MIPKKNRNKGGRVYESPVRKIILKGHNIEYRALENLGEAKKHSSTYLIMEGDEGGQIYLVCPVKKIKCKEKNLQLLLEELDSTSWNDVSMAGLYYEQHPVNSMIIGGMGGGRALEDLWIHKNFKKIKSKIKQVILGTKESIHTK